MDKQLLRERLKRALRLTVKGAFFLGPVTLISCSNGPYECGPYVPQGDAGLLADGGYDCTLACPSLVPTTEQTVMCSFQPANGGNAPNPLISCFYATQLCKPPSGGSLCGAPPNDCGLGRQPAWLLPAAAVRAHNAVGAFFAQVHRLEAASVFAFRQLGSELQAHGAPRQLVARARVAAADEVRHARSAARLARRFGGTPLRPELGPTPSGRSLEAVALENAVEGCVNETHGALVAAWQARSAGDPGVRRVMAGVAVDEARHAELAWAVAAWAEPRLRPAARRRVQRRRDAALTQLAGRPATDWPVELVALAGLPEATTGSRLAGNLARELGA